MKVLIVPGWYPNPFHATTGDFVLHQAQLLRRAGVDVSVLYNETNYQNLRQFRTKTNFALENGIPTTRMSGFAFPKVNEYFLKHWANQLEPALRLHLKNWGKPDLIHAHVWLGGYAARRIAQRLQIPYLMTEHSATILQDRLSHWKVPLVRAIYQDAACCLAISPALQHIFQQKYQVQRVKLLPNPIDDAIFYYQPLAASQSFTFVHIGDLIPSKRPASALAAFAKIAQKFSHVRLQFIGTGSLLASLQREVEQLKLTGRVQFLGQQTPQKVADYLRQANALVHTSEIETFGLVLAEAMCCGRPVVAVKSAGAQFIVTPETGILTESGVEAVAAGMEKLLKNDALFNVQHIAQKTNDRFGSETVIRQLIMLYERLR